MSKLYKVIVLRTEEGDGAEFTEHEEHYFVSAPDFNTVFSKFDDIVLDPKRELISIGMAANISMNLVKTVVPYPEDFVDNI